MDIRPVTEAFSVAPQLAPDELADVAARGFRLVVNNRPDGEAPGQPTSAQMAAAAEAAGLGYVHIPIRGGAGPGQASAMYEVLETADGPALAFCRSGTRSITVWARGQADAGARSREQLLQLAGQAGYDLSASI